MESAAMNESRHSRVRKAQRAISDEQAQFALKWGAAIRQPNGRTAYHVGRDSIDDATIAGVPIPDRVEGVTVVVASDNTVVTTVRTTDRRRLRTTGLNADRDYHSRM
jgi:hypothetical protein